MALHFFSEAVDFKVPNPRKTISWIKKTITTEGFRIGNINYIFCTDDYLFSMNKKFLNHTTLTDIITFDTSEEDGLVEGEVYISVERVTENAKKLNIPFAIELRRVMIHGVLHLVGYSDKTKRQKEAMRRKEDACLSLWH